jgi:hypothetical protein
MMLYAIPRYSIFHNHSGLMELLSGFGLNGFFVEVLLFCATRPAIDRLRLKEQDRFHSTDRNERECSPFRSRAESWHVPPLTTASAFPG